jgi:thymidine phosphorylase
VGVMVHKKVGDEVAVDEPLCTLYYNRSEQVEEARALIQSSYTMSAAPLLKSKALIHRIIEHAGAGTAVT